MFKNSKKVIKMKSHLIQKVENIFYTKNKTKKEAERNQPLKKLFRYNSFLNPLIIFLINK